MSNKKIIIIGAFISIAVLLIGPTSSSWAAVTMEEVQNLFVDETGVKWDDATSTQRKDFLYEHLGRKQVEARKERVKGETIPYFIKEGYYRDTGRGWSEASKIEQDDYIRLYKERKRNMDQAMESQLKEIKRAEAKRKKDKERKKKEKERIKKAKIRDRQLKEKRLQMKRKLEKIKLKRAMDEKTDLKAHLRNKFGIKGKRK